MEKEAILWRQLGGGRVECIACARRCKIPEGGRGFCFIRKNKGGKLYLDSYGKLEAVQLDPIEKKPFNHFMPGSYVLGVGTSSCNFGCLFCQNHNISKEREIKGVDIMPEKLVELAKHHGAQGIAFTYNEPTIFIEYALDVAKIAHEHGLFTMFVTNGYMTAEAVSEMKGVIDAAVVDFKGNGEDKFANKYEAIVSSDNIKTALLEMKKARIHIEITDLIIPKVGESLDACDKLTKWIESELGPDTPIQFTRFHPDYKMLDYPETPFATLLAHYNVARSNGLNYVYIGNVPGNKYESTYCPKCGAKLIGREGFYITEWNLTKENACPRCHTKVPIVGNIPQAFAYRNISVLY
ncbi:MAG: AmmeMemoRadiSam system radical SAM enzyme [Candidatus Micrarchaeaceae archaeon]